MKEIVLHAETEDALWTALESVGALTAPDPESGERGTLGKLLLTPDWRPVRETGETQEFDGIPLPVTEPLPGRYFVTLGLTPEQIEGLADVIDTDPPAGFPVWNRGTVDMDAERAKAKAKMIAWIDQFLAPLKAGYSQTEIDSWPSKGPAALRYIAGEAKADEVMMLETEADALQSRFPGTTAMDVARGVARKAVPYIKAHAITSALRQTTAAAIDAAEDKDDIDRALDVAQATAFAKAQEIGIR